nr:PREDICTED: testis-expressed sequence 26 protein isoform X2 [Paralichthys olivaceus]
MQSSMAAKEVEQWWDPYETCHRRQFVFRPNSAAEVLLCPMSTSFIGSTSQSGPFGSTVYHKEFCWKAACKPECIHTGTASGQRRNNPHPSQSFMTWRLPRDATQNPEYVQLPWKCPPSEGEIQKALTALYCSTYRCDFTSEPQGCDHVNNAEGRLAPLHSRRHVPRIPDTEMRDNYRQPKPKPELMGNRSHYSCNADPSRTRCGIVPTVVQRHVHTQQRGSDLTAYDRFCGKRVTNVASVVKSLFPQELQCLHRTLPAGEKEAVKTFMSKDAYPNSGAEENKLPAVVLKSCSPERISSWPGPV